MNSSQVVPGGHSLTACNAALTRTPPRQKSQMGAMGFQNTRRGAERGLNIGYWILDGYSKHFHEIFFLLVHPWHLHKNRFFSEMVVLIWSLIHADIRYLNPSARILFILRFLFFLVGNMFFLLFDFYYFRVRQFLAKKKLKIFYPTPLQGGY